MTSLTPPPQPLNYGGSLAQRNHSSQQNNESRTGLTETDSELYSQQQRKYRKVHAAINPISILNVTKSLALSNQVD